jgi:predicted ArsR family transcriptional regulator
MQTEAHGKAREKILFFLKTKGPQTAAQIARRLSVTPMAVRQHLYQLREEGQVSYVDERRQVGRPARVWELTRETASRFPDSHGELAAGILRAARQAFGDEGMARLVRQRRNEQADRYSQRLARKRGLEARVTELAGIRNEEGYMAEVERDGEALLLIENHCPICAAAETCADLCQSECELFREVLPGAEVTREEHILSGQRRCVYRVQPIARR